MPPVGDPDKLPGLADLLDGIVMVIGGSYSAGGAPFPVDGILPFLKSFADYSWVVGQIVSFVAYVALTVAFPNKATTPAPRLEPVERAI